MQLRYWLAEVLAGAGPCTPASYKELEGAGGSSVSIREGGEDDGCGIVAGITDRNETEMRLKWG